MMISNSTQTARSPRSTAEAQREKIVSRATTVFSHAGFHATPVAAVAEAAGVSPAYVFRLYPGKVALFVATIDHCFSQIRDALVAGGEGAKSRDPQVILAAMSDAYIELIRDRDLIMMQAHAQSACAVPEIQDAVRRGMAEIVRAVTQVSGADPASIQRLLAYGQLCHLIVQADLGGIDESWAHTISDGITEPAPRH